jgi:hypothetical protein
MGKRQFFYWRSFSSATVSKAAPGLSDGWYEDGVDGVDGVDGYMIRSRLGYMCTLSYSTGK